MTIKLFYLLFFFWNTIFFSSSLYQANLSAKEIVEKADQKSRGTSSEGEISMTIIRPDWSREVRMKTWSLGDDYALILITAPARDQGTAFLKRENEMWNWQPSIDRVIKLPPSMMSQSWMGSDFTNDDLIKQSSMVTDYSHQLLGEEELDGRACYKIQLIPNEDLAVTWNRIVMWIDKQEFLQLKTEFYDEEEYLMHTINGKNITEIGGRILPKILEVIPADEEGHKTVIEYDWMKFDHQINPEFFSIKNMKRVR